MKIFTKIMMGALLFTSASAFAQKGNGRGNGNNKNVMMNGQKTTGNMNGVMNANEHASTTGKMHADEHSVLNSPVVTTTTTTNKYKKHYHKHRPFRKMN